MTWKQSFKAKDDKLLLWDVGRKQIIINIRGIKVMKHKVSVIVPIYNVENI